MVITTPIRLGVIGVIEAFIITIIALTGLTGPVVEDQVSAGRYSFPPSQYQDQGRAAGNLFNKGGSIQECYPREKRFY